MFDLKNKRFHNFLSLFYGTFFSQILNFFFYIVLSRLYPETSFGLFSLFTSYMILTSVLTNPQIPLLSLSAKSEQEIDRIEALSESALLYSLVIIGIFFGVAFLIDYSPLEKYLLLLPFAVLFYTLTENRKVFHNQKEQFRQSNILTIVPRTGGNLLKIILFFLGKFGNGLILGEVVGNSYTFFRKLPHVHFSPAELYGSLKSYKRFFIFNYPSTLATVAITELLPFFLISLYDLETAGAFFLFEKLILQPFTLIGSAAGSSQAKYINELTPDSKITFFLKLLIISLMVSFPAMLAMYLWGHEIVFMLTKKQLFEQDLIFILACFIPIRFLRGIIYVFHHATLNWHWGVFARGFQVLSLLVIYYICSIYSLSIWWFFAFLLIPDYLGEILVIFKALKQREKVV